MCIFVVLLFSNVIMMFVYGWVVFTEKGFIHIIDNDSRPPTFSYLIIPMG